MCYVTLLSTTAELDLSSANNELVAFSKTLPGVPEEQYLAHRFKWHLSSRSGCSCEFRHLNASSIGLGFSEPEDWFPENVDQLEATRHIATLIRSLVRGGAAVDCVDTWAHGEPGAKSLAGELEVNLSSVSDKAFRFFELYRFTFADQGAADMPA